MDEDEILNEQMDYDLWMGDEELLKINVEEPCHGR